MQNREHTKHKNRPGATHINRACTITSTRNSGRTKKEPNRRKNLGQREAGTGAQTASHQRQPLSPTSPPRVRETAEDQKGISAVRTSDRERPGAAVASSSSLEPEELPPKPLKPQEQARACRWSDNKSRARARHMPDGKVCACLVNGFPSGPLPVSWMCSFRA